MVSVATKESLFFAHELRLRYNISLVTCHANHCVTVHVILGTRYVDVAYLPFIYRFLVHSTSPLAGEKGFSNIS